MFPSAFNYHRANSLSEAATMLAQLGSEARALAGGQSLIPLMKLRYANPAHLVDLNFIAGTSYIRLEGGVLRFGPLTRHAEIENSEAAMRVPIVHDCAAGIADVQVRNRGTIGGSVAEADPSGDWATTLLALNTEIRCVSPRGERTVPLQNFITDAYTTALAPDELVGEIRVKLPPKNSGGCYLAFKRCAPVYASAAAAVQLSMEDGHCRNAAIYLGCVGLTPVRATNAESELRGQPVTPDRINKAADAARSVIDPQPDMRGSAEYKRELAAGLLRRAIDVAARRAQGDHVEVSHIYA